MQRVPWLLILLAVTVLATSGCSPKKQPAAAAPQTRPPVMVGGDRDAHGCIGSAGYTFSRNRNECIRLFETGIRLNPRDVSLNPSLSAFIVLKAGETGDTAAAPELFLPHGALSSLMTAGSGRGTWKFQQYTLSYSNGRYTLNDASGKTLYQGPDVR